LREQVVDLGSSPAVLFHLLGLAYPSVVLKVAATAIPPLELTLGAIVLTFPLRSIDGRGRNVRVGVVAHDKKQIWDRETVIRIRPAAPSDPLRGVASLFMGHVMRALLI
jgi:hypothetical protein